MLRVPSSTEPFGWQLQFCEADAGCGLDWFGTELATFLRIQSMEDRLHKTPSNPFLGNLNADGVAT